MIYKECSFPHTDSYDTTWITINLYNIIESSNQLSAVCVCHTRWDRIIWTCSTDGKFYILPIVLDNFYILLAVFYDRTVHAILGVSYALQNASMPSWSAHVHDSTGEKYRSAFRPRLAKYHIVCIIKGFRPVIRQFPPGTAADAAAWCMSLEMLCEITNVWQRSE